jgi:hypothetical protein
MSDFNDATQEYENTGGSSTSISIINNENDLLTPPTISDANSLVKLISIDGLNQLYIIQANALGEIRFLTANAKNYNNQNGLLLYNTKIGQDGKLYFYHSYTILNIGKLSGWYDIGDNINSIEITNAIQDALIGGLTISVGTILNDISLVQTDLAGVNIVQELQTLQLEETFVRLRVLEARTGFDDYDTDEITEELINTALGEFYEIAENHIPNSVWTYAQQRARMSWSGKISNILYKVLTDTATGLAVLGFGTAVVAGIRALIDNSKEEEYKKEIINITNALNLRAISNDLTTLNHTGITIVSGNTGFATPNTKYSVEIQKDTILLISINATPTASVELVERVGLTDFTVGETITITKAQLGGGTGGNLVLSVASLGTFQVWADYRTTYLLSKTDGLQVKNRRKQNVIGADDIDTTQFTTTNVSYTDTTDTTTETITYKQLKSRLNLLPTGTSDVDIYTSTGKIGIGTTPTADRQLHIYNETYGVARIQSGTSGKSAIEFVRGLPDDDLVDFRLVNDTNLFRLQFQDIVGGVPIEFGDAGSYLMDVSKTTTRFYKDFQIDGKVGIGGTPHATIALDLVGSVRVSQNVGIGTEPAKQLHLYHPTDSVIRVSSGRYGKSSIEFIRASTTDPYVDFRFVNDNDLFRLQSQDGGMLFGADPITYLMDVSKTKTQFYKNFQIDGFVGIGTTPSQYYKLDVLGGARFTNGLNITGGSVGIGTTEPSNKLHIQSSTADTRITIEDVSASAIGVPTTIDFIDGGYSSVLVPTTTNELYAYLANDVITASKQIRFTLKQRMTVDLLLVGGGGAGGNFHGGGGGGGGVFYGKDLVMEAGSYVMIVGRGGVGVQGSTTQRSVNANGAPTMLCYDDGFLTPVKFSLGGVIQQAIGVGGGSGATNNAVPPKLTGWDGGSGGGSTDSITNSYAVNAGGLPTQGTTFWNGTSYEVGGTGGRSNTAGVGEEWAGGGGGGTASAPAPTTNYTCGKKAVQVPFMPTINYQVSAGGGGGASSTTDLSNTIGLGGDTVLGAIIGGYGAFKVVGGLNTSHQATDGANNTGSGGGGSGVSTSFGKAGNGGTGIAVIRYKLAERLNSSSIDLFRNQSSLIGYSIGNYEGQFKVYRDGIVIPSILINPLGNVAIKSRYNATQIFQVGEKGGRLRLANDATDFTQIGVNDEIATAPYIRMMGNSRTDGNQGNIEYKCAGSGKNIFTGGASFTGEGSFVGFVRSRYEAFHAVANHAIHTYAGNLPITSTANQGWDNLLLNSIDWIGSYYQNDLTAGVYFVSATCYMNNGNQSFSIRHNATTATNGTEYAVGKGVAGSLATATAIIRCALSDTITFWSGANGISITDNPRCSVSIHLIMAE